VFLELHIQIRAGKAAGTPMLRGHDITRVRFELGADLAAPPLNRPCLRYQVCWFSVKWRDVVLVSEYTAIFGGPVWKRSPRRLAAVLLARCAF
jgi:hypothetical protein